jgi:hypothetical protein
MGLIKNTQQEYFTGNNFGDYQFVSLSDIINQFMIVYVGEDKIIPKAKRTDVAFHAQRALAELSFDTFKSFKSKEIEVPATLQMILPQDYVNYTKLSWVDSSGIKHPIYPTKHTSTPKSYQLDSDKEHLFDSLGDIIPSGNLITNGNFHGGSHHWVLNEINYSTGQGGGVQQITTSIVATTLGDPVQGYFFGYNGNAIKAYSVPQHWGIRQANIPIIANEDYKIKYTVSGYTAGTWKIRIVDKNGDYSATTGITADGTYEETITASATAASMSPSSVIFVNTSTTEGTIVIDDISIVRVGSENESATLSNYRSITPSENRSDDYEDDTYWPLDGERYGLDPKHAQANGSFYMDELAGKIHFSSNISGKTVILDYISDSLGTDEEMKVHKFAEEAMYKHIAYAVLSTSAYGQALVPRFKREKFAETRKAKLRLSNVKLEEITQILRGKSKQIKH